VQVQKSTTNKTLGSSDEERRADEGGMDSAAGSGTRSTFLYGTRKAASATNGKD